MSSCENYDPCFPDQPVVDLYLPVWAAQPAFAHKPAFVWAEDSPTFTTWSSITYSQLNSSVQAIAANLRCTLQRGDTLLVLCPPGLQLVKILFASQRAGLVAVPIIPPSLSELSSSSSPHLSRVIKQTKPKAAVADHHYISSVTRLASKSSSESSDRLSELLANLQWLSVEYLDDEQPNHDRCAATVDHVENYPGCKHDEPYLIQYTSGATEIPKPVIVTAGAAAHNVRAGRRAYDLQPSSVIVSWLPQYHDCGLMFLLLTVVSGATCVLTSPTAFLIRPRLWLELISEFKATCTPVPSFALPLVARRGGINQGKVPLKLESLRNLILINEPIYKSPVQEFVEEFARAGLKPSSISPSYGLAENCTFVSTSWQWSASSGEAGCFPDIPEYKKLLPSARLACAPSSDKEDIEIMVVDEETCEPVEDGVEGEIWVSSASNASGYLDHPSLTREVFHARLRGALRHCFVRTGDRGVVGGEERYLYVVGRTSDVIRIGGGRVVHPHYLETAAYNSSPMHLRGGCIVAVSMESTEDGRDPSMTVAVVAELQRSRTEGLCHYKEICEAIRRGVMKEEGVEVGMAVLVESGSLPKTTSGKLRRFLAKDKLLRGSFPVVYKVQFDEPPVAKRDEPVSRRSGVGGTDRGEVMSFSGVDPRPQLRSFL